MKPAWDTLMAMLSDKDNSKYIPLFLRESQSILKINLILASVFILGTHIHKSPAIQALQGAKNVIKGR